MGHEAPSREDLIAALQSQALRPAFVASQVATTLARQIRAMREARGWSTAELAALMGTSPRTIARLERAQGSTTSLATLTRLAALFDVALAVQFVPMSVLVDRLTCLATDDVLVPSFAEDTDLKP
jgi:transcriptional regulator with XRE-family HTH domain